MDWSALKDFLIILMCFALVLALQPLILYPVSLLLLKKRFRRRTPMAGDQPFDGVADQRGTARDPAEPEISSPDILGPPSPDRSTTPIRASLCVCAYNEDANIREKAENLLLLKRTTPGLELLVYVDGATDRTAAILADYAADIDVVVSSMRTGKTCGMRRLVARARGDILVFSDANVLFDTDAVTALLARLDGDPSVGCVCGTLTYTNGGASATAEVGGLYWRFEEWIKRLEDEAGGVLCADGSIFAVRRRLYPLVPDDLIDDFYVSLTILCDGHRIVRAPDARAWERSSTTPGDEFRRKVRIACQAFNIHRALWPRLRRLPALTLYKYASHKLLRWLVGVNLAVTAVLAAPLGVLAFGWRPMLLVLLGGALVWGLGMAAGIRLFGKLTDVLLAFAATTAGLYRSLRGERFQTWTPAASVRTDIVHPAAGHDHRFASKRPLYANHIKRIVDILGSLVLLVLCMPLMLFIVLIIGRDGSPVLFRHERIGADGRRFRCLKFRTMHVNAEAMLSDLLARDPEIAREWREGFKLRDDPRVTAIGRFLRRTSLDELPQLFNVLRGDMSLVGPRPIIDQEVAFYDEGYTLYTQCRPGITGIWQISGRSDVSYARRVELDCAYVTTWSVSRDLIILLRTPVMVFRQWGAY